ncbi:MAG: alginate export family protein [Parvularculaceae bacterium]
MGRTIIASIIGALLVCTEASAEPWRAQSALAAPSWLTVKGESRVRYETLEGQFRANGDGGDQLLLFRTLIHAEADAGAVKFGLEIQDSRTYLGDAGTPLSSSIVNPIDVLQLYLTLPAPGLLGAGSSSEIQLGRQTVSIGSRRQIERVEYANVIRAYTGAHFLSSNPHGDELHLLYIAPVQRLPTDREELERNEIEFDREQLGRRIWGAHYRRADFLPRLASNVWGEAFIYGLDERDTDRVATPDRHYLTPGFRLFLAPQAGSFDFDIEGAFRFGSRRLTSAPDDAIDLKVRASSLIARVGYTFDAPWRPNIALQYYWASGDKDPADDRFDQYERLFGSRRTDLNNTSIHGPLTPANLSAPGVRIEVKPSSRLDARLHYSAASLASDTDSWVIAKLRDPTGESGGFIGHAIDTRARYWIAPGNLRLEIGASAFVFGEFARSVPAGPEGKRTLFGYTQLTATF